MGVEKWHNDFNNVLKLARWLEQEGEWIEAGADDDPIDRLIYYFHKPWKYGLEYEKMIAAESGEERKRIEDEEAKKSLCVCGRKEVLDHPVNEYGILMVDKLVCSSCRANAIVRNVAWNARR